MYDDAAVAKRHISRSRPSCMFSNRRSRQASISNSRRRSVRLWSAQPSMSPRRRGGIFAEAVGSRSCFCMGSKGISSRRGVVPRRIDFGMSQPHLAMLIYNDKRTDFYALAGARSSPVHLERFPRRRSQRLPSPPSSNDKVLGSGTGGGGWLPSSCAIGSQPIASIILYSGELVV